jgi:hypothetical protein
LTLVVELGGSRAALLHDERRASQRFAQQLAREIAATVRVGGGIA